MPKVLRTCKKCGEKKSKVDFPSKRSKYCTACAVTIPKTNKNIQNITLGEQGLRKCSKCNQIKSLTEYHNNKQDKKFGKKYLCIDCVHKHNINYHANKSKQK